jgi:hypothetical protein
MKNAINRFHRKILLDFNDEKINILFVRLQKIYGIIALTN